MKTTRAMVAGALNTMRAVRIRASVPFFAQRFGRVSNGVGGCGGAQAPLRCPARRGQQTSY
eukprot:14035600-Alexandrium_andersonii.AAC.1